SALPALWNRKMEDYLGVKPPNDAQGVLQDIHWSMGAFGYFPTYTLGNMYAAQLFNAARKDIADFDGKLERGEFQPLREWLRENVHRHGMRYRSEELCRKATGEALNAKHFTGYLTSKFSEIYKI
ncbi:MAG: carboxypeptidase M32, partial [Deltaproteobacteria bacterium]|nr:carboxypeptidase M32 [Deltaproteobacteria bacterium]